MAWERGYGHITLPHGYGYIYGTKGKGCVTEFFYIVKYSLEMRQELTQITIDQRMRRKKSHSQQSLSYIATTIASYIRRLLLQYPDIHGSFFAEM